MTRVKCPRPPCRYSHIVKRLNLNATAVRYGGTVIVRLGTRVRPSRWRSEACWMKVDAAGGLARRGDLGDRERGVAGCSIRL